ncbi:hypothetical protein SAMN05421823_11959 [Catalinimonas alkaloidigena]|uniref:Uncharacterized protein n=1 Tax=Catalinimonas alkaloidigena TaxID=1075417 RepID=A0A1G9VAB0_9BACT|nr:hypothetical protein [Catalinimonas alkaloidigena]SDM68795.1 hypothetical protein SAMN05421823_11959 [Catalinimonas alkaloidigena]
MCGCNAHLNYDGGTGADLLLQGLLNDVNPQVVSLREASEHDQFLGIGKGKGFLGLGKKSDGTPTEVSKAFNERGLFGALGQMTGLSTNAGAERRDERRDLKMDERQANIDALRGQNQVLDMLLPGAADPVTAGGSNERQIGGDQGVGGVPVLWLGIGGGALVLIVFVVILVATRK